MQRSIDPSTETGALNQGETMSTKAVLDLQKQKNLSNFEVLKTLECLAAKKPITALSGNDLIIPEPTKDRLPSVNTLTDDVTVGDVETVVISDLHAPYQREDLLMYIAKKHEGSRLVIGGDITHNDAFSRFDRREYPKSRNESLRHLGTKEILDYIVGSLYQVHQYFSDIKLIWGNHDNWMARELAKVTGGDASLLDELYGNYFSDHIPNCTIAQGTGRGRSLMKRGDAYIGHFYTYGAAKCSGAVKAIEWMLGDPEVAAAGEWNVLVQGHVHKMNQSIHMGKLALESGCLCREPDYYDARLGNFPAQQLGYVVLNQKDGITDWMESGTRLFPRKYCLEYMEIGGYKGLVYDTHNC